jgi:hypothetical protein
MVISKMSLPRRTVLRGIGTAMAMPYLDSMVPAFAAAPTPPRRFGAVYVGMGMHMAEWTQHADTLDASSILSPLAPYRDRCVVVAGLDSKEAISNDQGPHPRAQAAWLTGCRAKKTDGPDIRLGTSLDQILARAWERDTQISSLEFTVEPTDLAGSCAYGFSCAYNNTIAWRTPTTPLPMENNPRKLFQSLFGVGDNAAERERLGKQTASVLDLMVNESNDLAKQLGASDRVRLSDYLETVREVERRVQKTSEHDLGDLILPDAPLGIPGSFDEHINLQMDLILLAYQGNITRIANMMFAAEVSNQTYNHVGISDAFHPLSHHQNDPAKMARLMVIQEYHTKVFARFVDKLAALPDGDNGSMLDNAMLLYGSNMSNSNAHDHWPLPAAIIGKAGGRIKGGQHIMTAERSPISNLMMTILDRVGVPQEKLGDATGLISEV